MRTRKILISRPYWQATYFVFTIEFAVVWCWTCVLTPRTVEDEEQIDHEPEQLTLFMQETANNATSSSRLVAAIHWESRDTDSESFRTSSICQNGGNWTILYYQWLCHGWKQFYSSMRREYSGPRNSQHSRLLQADLNDHVKIGLELKKQIHRKFVFRSTSTVTTTMKFEVVGCVSHEELNTTHDHLFLQRLTTRCLEPRYHRSSWAAGDREHRRQVDSRQ